MLTRWMGALFAPKYPKHYTGRHRAPRLWRPVTAGVSVDEIR